MPYSKEEYTDAISIAERVVIRERRSSRALKANMPTCIIDSSREMQGSSMENLFDNRLAEKLLPQARIIVAERETRESALNGMSLGKMKIALGYVGASLAGGGKISGYDAPFSNEEDNKAWHELLEIIEGENGKKIVSCLYALLSSAHAELLFTDLPKIESKYKEVLE